MNKKIVIPAVVFTVGLLLVLLSTILGWAVLPNIIDKQIEKEIQLVPDTDAWERWEENPVPVYIEFYIFNITNPDFMDKRELPVMKEIGPFVYEEIRLKNDFQFHDDDTITFVQNITYIYRDEMSVSSAYDPNLTTFNSPFLILCQAIYELVPPAIANLLIELFFIDHGETFIRAGVSADEIMFSGVELIPSYGLILSFLDEIPPNFSDGRFGFYRGVNETADGVYRVHNGVRNARDVGKIVTWNGERYLDWWKSPDDYESDKVEDMYCNAINGSEGSTFPPFTKKTDLLRVFVTDICRSLVLTYEQEVKHRDIPGLRFVLPKSFYEDPKINADNYCFCPSTPGDLDKSCEGGVNRMFPCQDGAPIVASSPHFLMTEGEVMERALKMELTPDHEKHMTKIDVEPNTGSTLSIHKRLQINMEVQKLTSVRYFDNITRFLCPIFWADEYADIDEKNADDIKSSLLTPLKIIKISKWTVLAVGIVLVVAAIGIFVYFRRK